MEALLQATVAAVVVYLLLIRPAVQGWTEVKNDAAHWERVARDHYSQVTQDLDAISSWITEEIEAIDGEMFEDLNSHYYGGLAVQEMWMAAGSWAVSKGHFNKKRVDAIDDLVSETTAWLNEAVRLTDLANRRKTEYYASSAKRAVRHGRNHAPDASGAAATRAKGRTA